MNNMDLFKSTIYRLQDKIVAFLSLTQQIETSDMTLQVPKISQWVNNCSRLICVVIVKHPAFQPAGLHHVNNFSPTSF